jgi:hypothetical protein
MHNVIMRGAKDRSRAHQNQIPSQQPRVQLSRGHWRREEREGAIRTAGWWESVTVTWPSAAAPEHRPPFLRSALAAAFDTIAPSIAELVAASARRLLERQHGTRTAFPSARRQLRTVTRELPQSEQSP